MKRVIVLLCVVSTFLLGVVGTAAAHPDNSQVFGNAFVDGSDSPTDDFGEHFGELGNSLCNGCPDSFNTDLVIMWQAILAADGFLPVSEIDGQFGPITASATTRWQTRWGIDVDGEVGNQTWSKADNGLYQSSGVGGRPHYVMYNGDGSGAVTFRRGNENIANDAGAYELYTLTAQDGRTWVFSGGPRIRFNAKTVSGPFGPL